MSKRFFVTGTDTEVGKTVLTVALIKAAQKAGHTAIGCKPVSAGCDVVDGQWQNEDAVAIREAGSVPLSYEQVNPVALIEAMAPHIAAESEGVTLNADMLAKHIDGLPEADYTFIEGAGGWLVPLNDDETLADVATAIQTPVIMVTGLRLGCINHSLLTVEAIRAAGLKLAGWIGNCVDPDMVARESNIATLRQQIDAPLIGIVPWMGTYDLDQVIAELDFSILEAQL